MERREVLSILGATAALPIFSSDLMAFGREVHALLAGETGLRTLDAHQNATVTTMAELIIPATDTPGAKAARVNEFIDVILTEWFSDQDKQRFLEGLADVDARCRKTGGKDFVDCDERQQVAFLTVLDAEVTRLRESQRTPQRHFFHMMKRWTLIGYFTSEIGTPPDQRHFVLDVYRPCAPIDEGPKAL